MNAVAIAVRKLKEWGKSRPQLDVEQSATWFLLLFVYAHGLTTDELGFKWSGLIPELTVPQLSLAMALLCLTASVVVLVEPLLPAKVRARTKAVRLSGAGLYFRRLSVLFAFILGMVTGFGLLVEKVPTYSWMASSVVYVGFVIFIVMGINVVLLAWRENLAVKRSA